MFATEDLTARLPAWTNPDASRGFLGKALGRETARSLALACVFSALLLMSAPFARSAESPDPYLWLESISSAKSSAWVNAENAKTLSRLESDPRFPGLQKDALAVFESDDRIAEPTFVHGQVYTLWQDRDHRQGEWRRTSVSSYLSDHPRWRSVLDVDALGRRENVNWVFQGADCPRQAAGHCLIRLSNGGEDATRVREFDPGTGRFVSNGFDLPRSKQRVVWEDKDTLLVTRDWGGGTLASTGYGFVIKRLKRGQSLDEAKEVFRGDPGDGGYGVTPMVLSDGSGHRLELIVRPRNTFEFETWLLSARGPRKLALPPKVSIHDLVKGQLVITLKSDWSAAPGKAAIPAGSVVAFDGDKLLAQPDHLEPVVIFSPGERQGAEDVQATRDRLIVTWLDNVRSRGAIYHWTAQGWRARSLAIPDNSTVSIRATNTLNDQAFLETTSFISPPTLWLSDGRSATLRKVKSVKAQFDTTGLVAEQMEATSTDGVRIPYFIVHPKDAKSDGNTPTLMTAYGGFDISETPTYLGSVGKLWLERGGAFVLANIRGGGEFGPSWHEAGMKTRRQIVFDDFVSVANDLFRRGLTSPRHLGIRGRSNGGLLMGVEMTQHPEDWNAVIIGVPLLDMLRYEEIAAGASWAGEYGSVSVPAERAFLASISPYNNLKAGVNYPEPYIFTTTKDDRVGPQHARKFAARLAELGKPHLYYELDEGGHRADANMKERAHSHALEIVYLLQKLSDPPPANAP